jgi:hypothetical protein
MRGMSDIADQFVRREEPLTFGVPGMVDDRALIDIAIVQPSRSAKLA